MRRRFAPLGIRIVNVMVEGELVPFFGHLKQMIPAQKGADCPWLADYRHAEIMSQFQLPEFVVAGAHHFFHNLEEDPRGILPHMRFPPVHNLVTQAAQGAYAFVGFSGFQGLQQPYCRIGHSQSGRGRQLFDPARMKVWVEEVFQVLEGFSMVEYVIYDAQQFVVAIIEKDSRDLPSHEVLPVCTQLRSHLKPAKIARSSQAIAVPLFYFDQPDYEKDLPKLSLTSNIEHVQKKE